MRFSRRLRLDSTLLEFKRIGCTENRKVTISRFSFVLVKKYVTKCIKYIVMCDRFCENNGNGYKTDNSINDSTPVRQKLISTEPSPNKVIVLC